MKLKEIKERTSGEVVYALIILTGILFALYAIIAFFGSSFLRELIGTGITYIIGFAAVLYLLLLKEKDISEKVIYLITGIICFCSIIITIVYAFVGSGDSRNFWLITLPVAIIGVITTISIVLAIRVKKTVTMMAAIFILRISIQSCFVSLKSSVM